MSQPRKLLNDPSLNRPNGDRDDRGRFKRGNPGGPGNPFGKKVQALRVAMVSAVTTDDLTAVVRRLLQQARDGDVASAKVLLDRVLGPPNALDIAEEIEDLRIRLDELATKRSFI